MRKDCCRTSEFPNDTVKRDSWKFVKTKYNSFRKRENIVVYKRETENFWTRKFYQRCQVLSVSRTSKNWQIITLKFACFKKLASMEPMPHMEAGTWWLNGFKRRCKALVSGTGESFGTRSRWMEYFPYIFDEFFLVFFLHLYWLPLMALPNLVVASIFPWLLCDVIRKLVVTSATLSRMKEQ